MTQERRDDSILPFLLPLRARKEEGEGKTISPRDIGGFYSSPASSSLQTRKKEEEALQKMPTPRNQMHCVESKKKGEKSERSWCSGTLGLTKKEKEEEEEEEERTEKSIVEMLEQTSDARRKGHRARLPHSFFLVGGGGSFLCADVSSSSLTTVGGAEGKRPLTGFGWVNRPLPPPSLLSLFLPLYVHH